MHLQARHVARQHTPQGFQQAVDLYREKVDEAFHWLERELEVNGASAFIEYQWDPMPAPLRQDPRWQALLARAGYSRAHRDAIDFAVTLGTEGFERRPVAAVR